MLLVLSPKSIFRYLGGTFLAHAEFAFFVSLGIHSISRVRDLSPFVLASRLTFRQVWVPTRSTRCFQNAKSFSLWLFTYGDGGESLLRIASHLIPTCRTGKNGGKPAPANCPSWNLEVLLWLNPRQSNHYRDSALSDPP